MLNPLTWGRVYTLCPQPKHTPLCPCLPRRCAAQSLARWGAGPRKQEEGRAGVRSAPAVQTGARLQGCGGYVVGAGLWIAGVRLQW